MHLTALLIFELLSNNKPTIWSLLCEHYQLPQNKLSWWSWSNNNTFKTTVTGLSKDLLNRIENKTHTIMRSETWEHYSIHLLKVNQFGFVVLMHGGHRASPVHIVFEHLFNLSRMDIIEPQRFRFLIERINDDLVRYNDQIANFNQIQTEIDQVTNSLKQTIEKVVAQNETIEALIDKTEHLSYEAQNFKRYSKRLNRCCYFF